MYVKTIKALRPCEVREYLVHGGIDRNREVRDWLARHATPDCWETQMCCDMDATSAVAVMFDIGCEGDEVAFVRRWREHMVER